MPSDVTDDTLEAAVTNTAGVVLVDIWASWCAPCRMLGPVLDRLEETQEDVTVFKLDADVNPKTLMAQGVSGIPTVLVYRDGKPVAQSVGARPLGFWLGQLEAWRAVT